MWKLERNVVIYNHNVSFLFVEIVPRAKALTK